MMDSETFIAGVEYLEKAYSHPIDRERKRIYYDALKCIPENLWRNGVRNVTATTRFFPSIAELGEACVPGDAETEDCDKWTGRWKKIATPWHCRLARIESRPVPVPIAHVTPVPQIPGPRDPLTVHEVAVLKRFDWGGLKQDIAERLKKSQERPKYDPTQEPCAFNRTPGVLNTDSPEYKALDAYWTPERTEARREQLHRQYVWIMKREQVERDGGEFTEPKPEAEIDADYPMWAK